MNHFSHHLYNHFAELECDHKTFFRTDLTSAQKCQIAKTHCDDDFDFVNFFMLSYCQLGGNPIVSASCGLFIIFLIFRFVSGVVEGYLAPSIAYISEWLKLPEALAAVTLLALANGAGDVITALVASGSSDGISYNIGSIYGAGLFVCSIVVAMTINSSPSDIQLEPSSIWRDVGIYIVATVTVIGFAIQGELSKWSALIMLVEYSVLVLIVWYQEKQKEGGEAQAEEKDEGEDKEKKIQNNSSVVVDKSKKLQEKNLIVFIDDKTEEEKKAESKKWKQPLSKMNTLSAGKKLKLLTQKLHAVVYMAMKIQIKQQEKEAKFSDMSFEDKIFFIIDWPFQMIQKITLPPCEEEQWDKTWAVVFPAPFILFTLFIVTLDPQIWWLGTIPVGLLISGAIYLTSKEKSTPSYYILLELCGTIGALMWTYLVSGILIDLLNFLGMISKLDTTYMGLTIIAVGNALPDAVTTVALAKQGYALMGLTGAYAGQLFGLLVGFGLALLKKTLAEGPQKFDLFADLNKNLMNISVILVSLLNLVITFIYGVSNHYKYTKVLSKIIGGLYIIFCTAATMYAIHKALHS